MSEPFAGVTIPDNVGQESSVAPETTQQVSGSEQPLSTQSSAEPQTTTDLVDLDKLERVRFGGKESTIKELRDSLMRHGDYTRKTKELADARKFADNFHYDYVQVLRNPQLLDQFKQIYPYQYVSVVEQALKELGPRDGSQQPEPGSQAQATDPRYEELLKKVNAWEMSVKEQETQAISKQLDSIHDRLSKKYPYVDAELVDYRVGVAREQGVEVTAENLDKVYEAVYKHLNERYSQQVGAIQKQKAKEQVKAGQAARDVGGGAGLPASPPKKYSKFSEINKDVLSQFGGK